MTTTLPSNAEQAEEITHAVLVDTTVAPDTHRLALAAAQVLATLALADQVKQLAEILDDGLHGLAETTASGLYWANPPTLRRRLWWRVTRAGR